MRILLGLLVLASLFWMAAAWQARHTGRLRREREQVHGRVVRPSRFAEEATSGSASSELVPPPGHTSAGWSTLVVGRPSGAPARPRPEALPEEAGHESTAEGPGAGIATPPLAGAPPPPSNAFRYRVRRGDVLGTICADYYGTERGSFDNLTQLTLAVARFNDMQTPDAIRAGDEILLPPLAALRP